MPEDALARARANRLALREAMAALEDAVASPARATDWQAEVGRSLERLHLAVADHIAEVERQGGLFQQILLDAPRLAPAVEALRLEHQEIELAIDTGVAMAATRSESADAELAAEIRASALSLLGKIVQHRQRGSDLVFDAYDVDIGGG